MSSFSINNFQEVNGRVGVSFEQKRLDRQRRIRRFFWRLIFLLLGLLGVELFFHLFLVHNIVITSVRINVSRDFPLDDGAIMEAAGLTGTLHYFNFSPVKAALRLEELPQVARAEVVKVFPRSLTVNIIPREPLVLSLASNEGGDVPLVVDSQGVVFAVGPGPHLRDLPIISGIRFPKIQRGMKLPEAVKPFLEQLDQLRREAPALLDIISELRFVKRSGANYDVFLYFQGYRTRVLIENKINEESLKHILLTLDATHRKGINSSFSEFDFRSRRIVYKTWEG